MTHAGRAGLGADVSGLAHHLAESAGRASGSTPTAGPALGRAVNSAPPGEAIRLADGRRLGQHRAKPNNLTNAKWRAGLCSLRGGLCSMLRAFTA